MKRREFITLLGGAAAAWPLAARAQQPAMPVIGFLSGSSPLAYAPLLAAFQQGLRELATSRVGTSRSNIAGRRADYDRLPALAAELVRPSGDSDRRDRRTARGARRQGGDHYDPDRVSAGRDPVKHGLVASLNRPGGNVTGVT